MEEEVPKNEDPVFLASGVDLVVTSIQTYGWIVLLVVLVAYYIFSKMKPKLETLQRQREDSAYKKTDMNKASSRFEAMERARQKMQEEFDAQAKVYAEKEAEKEEKRRQEKIEDWDRHVEGKGYRSKVKPSSSSGPTQYKTKESAKPKPKTTLRPDYNPLMGGSSSSDSCRYVPGRRGGAGGGG